jgi:hypothetical protein
VVIKFTQRKVSRAFRWDVRREIMKNHFELQPTVKKSVDKLPVYVYSLFLNDRRIS